MAETTHGARIGELMEQQGLSLLQLAERIDMDPSQLRRVKNRQTNPTRKTLARIADGLGVSVADLLAEPATSPAASEAGPSGEWIDAKQSRGLGEVQALGQEEAEGQRRRAEDARMRDRRGR